MNREPSFLMAYNFGVARSGRELRMPPRRQRRRSTAPRADAEKLERDFWRAIDLDKLMNGWGRNPVARGV